MRRNDTSRADGRRRVDGSHPRIELFERSYEDLCRIARRRRFAAAGPDDGRSVALVHETYVRFRRRWRSLPQQVVTERAAFLRVVTLMMKTVAIDRWRRERAGKRGGGKLRSLEASDPPDPAGADRPGPELIAALDEALEGLRVEQPGWFEIVVQRYFIGRSHAETARALGIDRREVRQGRRQALIWLRRALVRDG